MLLNDLFHIYAAKHNVETDGMLQDYIVDSRLDRKALNKYILLELGDRRPYYNDTEVMKFAIDTWFETHYRNIQVLVDTLYTEYNPLTPNEFWEDKDTATRTDITHENLLENNYVPATSDVTSETSKSSNESESKETGSETTEQQISAYNQSGYQDQAKTTVTPKTNSSSKNSSDTTFDNETKHKADANSENGFDGKPFSTKGDFTKQRTMTHDVGEADENTTDEHLHHYGREDVVDLKGKEWRAARYNVYQWICDNLGEKICLSIF